MIKEIETVVTPFRSCFTRTAALDWFVVIVLGLMIRVDHQGVSAIIRWLFLDPMHYKALTWFFRARSWELEDVTKQWCAVVVQCFPLVHINGRVILAGDGIKVAKQAEKMPAVKRLHQEENLANKPEYILGQHHGVVGVLAHRATKLECVPVAAALQEGIGDIRVLQGQETAETAAPSGKSRRRTLVTRMADLVGGVAAALGLPSYAVLDAFFAAGPLFKALGAWVDDQKQRRVHVIVRGKKSAVGYQDLPRAVSPRPKGRPRKYGEKVKLWELLETAAASFVACTIPMYGGVHAVKYLCVDLLWRPVQTKVRFVLVQDGDACYLLMSSDLTLTPEMIIWLYATRFKIEVTRLTLVSQGQPAPRINKEFHRGSPYNSLSMSFARAP